ncbi:MAG: zinc ribbon domain-containing protein [bacterium]|nr:zinc ribbon domain-containing protein [bacterium]
MNEQLDGQQQRRYQDESKITTEDPQSEIRNPKSESCPQCNSEIVVEANFCPKCGIHLTEGGADRIEIERIMADERIRQRVRQEMSPRKQPQKSPWLAAVLSLVWIGLGQLYLSRYFKGLALMVLFLISSVFAASLAALAALGKVKGGVPVFVLTLVAGALWLYSIIDAYLTAKQINEGEEFEPINWSIWAIPVITVEIVFLLLLGLVSRIVFESL